MVEPDFSSAGIVGEVHACACNVLESAIFHPSALEIEVIATFVGFAEAVSFFPRDFLHEQGHPYPVAEGIQLAPVKISIEFGAAAHGIGEREGAVADLPNAVGDGKVPKRPVAHRTWELQKTLKFGLGGRFAGEERRQQQQQNERFAKEEQATTADHGKQDREIWRSVGLVRFANALSARCLSWQSATDALGFGVNLVGSLGQRKAFDGLPMAKLLPQILAATASPTSSHQVIRQPPIVPVMGLDGRRQRLKFINDSPAIGCSASTNASP